MDIRKDIVYVINDKEYDLNIPIASHAACFYHYKQTSTNTL